MSNSFERGSGWRKWDLHIHTPRTKLNNNYRIGNGQDVWDYFCEKIEQSDVSVFGIADYFSASNFTLLKDKFYKKYPKSEKIIFPNIEFRLDSKNSKDEHIQLHVIFNDKQGTLDKLNDFLTRLKLVSTDDSNLTNKYCTDEGLQDVGFNKAMVKLDDLTKALKNDFSKHEYLIIGVANGYGSLRPRVNDGRGSEYAKELDKVSDLFFGNSSNTDFFLNKVEGRAQYQLPPKPVLNGCDSHSFEDLENKLGKEYKKKDDEGKVSDCSEVTWIKADLTFEGLKQILCEPKDRVKIQANKPEEKSGYHVIKSIEIDSDICKQNILLNPNLNTIIGGRSTGKSTLLQLIAHRVNPSIPDIKPFIADIPQEAIKIIWQDGEENKDRDIEFFPQSHMYEIARNKEKKNKLIQDIVEEKDDKSLIKNYENFCASNKSTLQTNLDDLFQLQANINELTTTLKEKGDESGLKKEIENIQNKIKDSQQDNSFSEEELHQYEKLKKEILELEQLLQKQERDKNEISILKDEDLFNSSFSYKFNQLSDLNSKAIEEIFDSVRQKAIKEWQDKLSAKLTEIDELIEKYKTEIQGKKASDSFKKGSSQLEQNKQYRELNQRLAIENKKLAEITLLQKKIGNINTQKKILFEQIVQNNIAFVTKIDALIRNFSLMHDDIEIKIKKFYRHDKGKELLKDFINLQSHDRQSFVNDWGNKYEADAKSNIEEFLKQSLENKIELKAYKEIKDLTKGLLTENWFSISYELTYQNDTFNKMSDGKKAFVILKLLLEFSHKECPILIDQPEDSLDNRAIYNELVAYLKQKKKDRQIILVTHNANIVVNADAEEVIVANQHGEDSKNQNDIKFQYITGSLENTKPIDAKIDIVLQSQGIREHVCEILEGGTEAFKKRENKYAIGDMK